MGESAAPAGAPVALHSAADAIRRRLDPLAPSIAIVLGSGLGGVAERIAGAIRIPFAGVPGLPPATVAGHAGEFIAGNLAGRAVLAQRGRTHLYEGSAAMALPPRLFAALGIGVMVVTNAAGGIRPGFASGTLMLIADHLNLSFRNPLLGAVWSGEARFPDMSDPYDADLRNSARRIACERAIALEEGVYAGVLGPSYETPAEIRMLARLGADAVGMSTVAEVIAARAAGLRCLGLSVVTNRAAGLGAGITSHTEVVDAAGRAGATLGALLEAVVAEIA
ncbi:MAG TPA: purine-nucleoside phosphorylase [Gemmatimonadales bacterium]|nr:purine-nucleoside phosphorylase [Gemmatimonadales bacterium]